MLEPGCKMIKAIGLLVAMAVVFHVIKLVIISYILGGSAVLLGIVLVYD